jgi:nucleoside-diphosphate-sugar epimerase
MNPSAPVRLAIDGLDFSIYIAVGLLIAGWRKTVAGNAQTFLVTGAKGCIGAWVVKNLVEMGRQTIIFDLDSESNRLRSIMREEQIGEVTFVRGDISDSESLERVVATKGVTHLIHLAGL